MRAIGVQACVQRKHTSVVELWRNSQKNTILPASRAMRELPNGVHYAVVRYREEQDMTNASDESQKPWSRKINTLLPRARDKIKTLKTQKWMIKMIVRLWFIARVLVRTKIISHAFQRWLEFIQAGLFILHVSHTLSDSRFFFVWHYILYIIN